jgi:hypothetical protein
MLLKTRRGDEVLARLASSCLLAPAIGDRVLVCIDDVDAYILAVLERNDANVATLAVPGARSVRITAKGSIEFRAKVMRLTSQNIGVVAQKITQSTEVMTTAAKLVVETMIDRIVSARTITTKAETRTSDIKNVEAQSVGTLVQNVDSVATQNSEISMITAKRDVRLDAERVSVG